MDPDADSGEHNGSAPAPHLPWSLDLPHGRVDLPLFVPDATQGVVRGLDATDLQTVGVDALQMNVFHLMQKPGSSAIKALGEISDANKFQLKNIQLKPSSTIVILSDEEMDAYLNHNVYGTGKGEDSLIDAEFCKQLMVTFNSSASYEQLVNAFSKDSTALDMQAVMAHAAK